MWRILLSVGSGSQQDGELERGCNGKMVFPWSSAIKLSLQSQATAFWWLAAASLFSFFATLLCYSAALTFWGPSASGVWAFMGPGLGDRVDQKATFEPANWNACTHFGLWSKAWVCGLSKDHLLLPTTFLLPVHISIFKKGYFSPIISNIENMKNLPEIYKISLSGWDRGRMKET